MIYSFVVPGKPQGKARPRFDSRRKVTYTPQKTKDYEELVRNSYLSCFMGMPPLKGALSAEIIVFFPIPKSAQKLKRESMKNGKIKPTVKPDLDNIIKAVLDALNGYAYEDDATVVKIRAEKRYSDEPRVKVVLIDESGMSYFGG